MFYFYRLKKERLATYSSREFIFNAKNIIIYLFISLLEVWNIHLHPFSSQHNLQLPPKLSHRETQRYMKLTEDISLETKQNTR